ncbi:hypothetical protein [Rubripirellula amarantea]|uniref:hypothetical protein n=1 Tax=Rubripirellula amarantea TaxID=2527999 RepID=UPI0011B41B62|nr:hypothetical protein [Rubripirellula amarantea]
MTLTWGDSSVSSSNVRNIESLEAFQAGLIRLSSDWEQAIQEVRMMVHRAEEYFSSDRPAYWRRQTQLAERELTQAKDDLVVKRSAPRAEDRPAATEAVKRVKLAEARLRLCEAKKRAAKKWSLEVKQQCDDLLGPIADVAEHCEVLLPSAAAELRQLIEQLKLYADKSDT